MFTFWDLGVRWVWKLGGHSNTQVKYKPDGEHNSSQPKNEDFTSALLKLERHVLLFPGP